MAQFFDMGGYGGFIWSAWGVVVLVLGGLLVVSLLQRARVRRMLGAQGLERVILDLFDLHQPIAELVEHRFEPADLVFDVASLLHDVLDHTHDLARDPAQGHAPAERFLGGKLARREGFADHGDRRSVLAVGVLEEATAPQLDPERLEVAGAHRLQARHRLFRFVLRRPAVDRVADRRVPEIAPRQARHGGRALDTRQLLEGSQQLALVRHHGRVLGVPILEHRELEGEQADGVEGSAERLRAQHDDMRALLWALGTASPAGERSRYEADLAELQALFDGHAAEEEARLYPILGRLLARG